MSGLTAGNEGIGRLPISVGSSMQMGPAFGNLAVAGIAAIASDELFSIVGRLTSASAGRIVFAKIVFLILYE